MSKVITTIVIGTLTAASAAVLYIHAQQNTTAQQTDTKTVLESDIREDVIPTKATTTNPEDVREVVTQSGEGKNQIEKVLEDESDELVIEESTPGGVVTRALWVPKTDEECAALILNSPFYLDENAVALRRERMHRENGEFETANLLREISCYPQSIWLTWSDAESMRGRVETIVEKASLVNKIPVFVIYNSPNHGSTKWWVGNQGEDYLHWIEQVAKGIGEYESWIIVEPDALGLSTDYNEEDKTYRLQELSAAVSLLKKYASNSRVYLDAGHSKWKTPETFAELLRGAGIENADGFALNISNYQSLEDETARGVALSKLVNDKHFIIDTSRNGIGAPDNHEWCNAPGRALGIPPTVETDNPLVDAYFWIKPPGESDGLCNQGPTPGQFWLDYALMLVRNAHNIED